MKAKNKQELLNNKLKYPGRNCGVLWTFERFVDMSLSGHTRDVVRDVSKTECEDACLKENGFNCLSANYDHTLRECHLNDQSKATRPGDFVGKQGVDYLENQCEAGKKVHNSIQCVFAYSRW